MYARHAADPRTLGWLAMGRGPTGHGHPRGGRFGSPSFGPPQFGMPRGRRARRGAARVAILLLLAEEPRNGYGLMQEIERRSEGAWRPSPGSVYPALAQLEDEGLVRVREGDEGKAYELTDAGRAQVAERGEAPAPWDTVRGTPGGPEGELMGEMRAVAMALTQVAQTGTPEQVTEARRLLGDTRRALYRLLAEDEPREDAPRV